MVVPGLILVFSSALFFFYCQVTVQKILRRTFDQAYYQAIVAANHLQFPLLRQAFEEHSAPVNYAHLQVNMRCDFLALTYLLKNASNVRQCYSRDERLLMFHFRVIFVSLAVRHWLRLQEKPAVLVLAEILQYFANVIGKRINSLRFADLSFAEAVLTRQSARSAGNAVLIPK
jgi:hypothetical protein